MRGEQVDDRELGRERLGRVNDRSERGLVNWRSQS